MADKHDQTTVRNGDDAARKRQSRHDEGAESFQAERQLSAEMEALASEPGLAGGTSTAAGMTRLQRAFGNQAVQRLVAQRQAVLNTQEDAALADAELGQQIQSQQGRGRNLPPAVQRRLESGLGSDLSGVRVHDDGQADRLARSVDALAFTSGPDIFFQSGAYQPQSPHGLEVLAHEATHTVQQAAGPVEGTLVADGVAISRPSDQFEQVAERSATHIANGGQSSALRAAAPRRSTLQRVALQRLYLTQPFADIGKEVRVHFKGYDKLVEAIRAYRTGVNKGASAATLQGLLNTVQDRVNNDLPGKLSDDLFKRYTTLAAELKTERARLAEPPTAQPQVTQQPAQPQVVQQQAQPQVVQQPALPQVVQQPALQQVVQQPVLPQLMPTVQQQMTQQAVLPQLKPTAQQQAPQLPAPQLLSTVQQPTVQLSAPQLHPIVTEEVEVFHLPMPQLKPTVQQQVAQQQVAQQPVLAQPQAVIQQPAVQLPVPQAAVQLPPVQQQVAQQPVLAQPQAPVQHPPVQLPQPQAAIQLPPVQQLVAQQAAVQPVVPDQTAQPQVVQQPAPIAAPNPPLLPADEAQVGIKKTIIRKGASYTAATGALTYTAADPTTGTAAIPAGCNRQITLDSKYRSADLDTIYTAGALELATFVGPSKYNRQLKAGGAYKVGTQGFTSSAPKLATFVSEQGDVVTLKLADDRLAKCAKADVEVVSYVDLKRPNNKFVVAESAIVSSVSTVSVRVDNKPMLVKVEDTSGAETGYKALDTVAPLFPAGGAKPEHIRQTGLGDCYLQSVLISIANTNPKHFEQMMPDTPGQASVTVTFYDVIKDAGETKYNASPITIEKSLPESASGGALYNAGANWARLIQKAFAVFAGKYGKYGAAYAAEDPQTAGGYADIASGSEFQLYGVFYGPSLKAPASRAQMTYVASASDPENLMSNQETIKKLLQFKGQGIAEGEVVNLTTGGYLLGHMKRASDILPACIAAVPSTVTNLPWFKQELDKAIIQEANPANKNKTLDQKPLVKAAVAAAAEALKGDWGPLVETIKANPDSRELNTLHELLLDIKTAGTDTSKGQRFIYGAHAYTIIDVAFKRANSAVFVPRIDHLATDLPEVSANQSTVTLRNPHHGNEPNPTGAPEIPEGPDQGKFSVTLAQYFRNFTEIDYGRVKATT